MNDCKKCKYCDIIPIYDGDAYIYNCKKCCTTDIMSGFKIPTPCDEVREVVGDHCPQYKESWWRILWNWLFN